MLRLLNVMRCITIVFSSYPEEGLIVHLVATSACILRFLDIFECLAPVVSRLTKYDLIGGVDILTLRSLMMYVLTRGYAREVHFLWIYRM